MGSPLVRPEEIIHQFGGRLDGRNGKNETPAHLCANNNATLGALQYLYDMVPQSFEVLDSNQQTPEGIAKKERNDARIVFAKIEAEKRALKAQKLRDMADEKAKEADMQRRLAEKRALEQQVENAKKCQDRLLMDEICQCHGLYYGDFCVGLSGAWGPSEEIVCVQRRRPCQGAARRGGSKRWGFESATNSSRPFETFGQLRHIPIVP